MLFIIFIYPNMRRCLWILLLLSELFVLGKRKKKTPTNSNVLVGGILRIDIMRHGTSTSIARTFLGDKDISIFKGSVPFPNGQMGELVPFTPIDACTSLRRSNYTTNDGEIKNDNGGQTNQVIALVYGGGNCSLSEKFNNAERESSVDGIIVFGGPNQQQVQLDQLISVDGNTKNIPGMLISEDLGRSLFNKINEYRQLGPDTDFSLPPSDIESPDREKNSPLVAPSLNEDQAWIRITMYYLGTQKTNWKSLVASILAMLAGVLLLGLLGSIGLHYGEFLEARQRARDNENKAPPITQDLIDALSIRRYNSLKRRRLNSEQKENPQERQGEIWKEESQPKSLLEQFEAERHWANDTCPVCLDEFEGGENLNELPCGHCFHMSCVQPWLLNRSSECPICKADVRIGIKQRHLRQAGLLSDNNMNDSSGGNEPEILQITFSQYLFRKIKAVFVKRRETPLDSSPASAV